MKLPQVKLKKEFQFENIYGEIITIKKGVILGSLAPGVYTPPTHLSCLWKCGKSKYDFTIISIPKEYCAPYNPKAQQKAIQKRISGE